MAKKQSPSTSTMVARLDRWLPYILLIAGIIGTLSAYIITDDKFKLAENPNYVPSCSINPVISCGSVMQSAQSHAFGFMNTYIGLIGFPVIITLAVLLLSGTVLRRWIWIGLQSGLFLGVLFVHWLFFEAVYRIHALCPYCMAVWVVTIISFWYVLLYNLQHKNIVLSGKWQGVVKFARRHHLDILVLWLLIIAVLILHYFWYYFGKHLPF